MLIVSLFRFVNFYIDLNKYLLRFYFQNREGLAYIRNRQFKQIINYAYTKIPFYRDSIVSSNIDLKKIDGLKQIKHLPTTDAEDLFFRQERMSDYKNRQYITLRSSGTTGSPKDVILSYFDWFYLRRLAYLRMFFTSGCSVFHKTLFLSSQMPYSAAKPRWFQRLGAMRVKSIHTNNLDRKIADFFNQYQPDVFHCLTADGVILADLINSSTKRMHRAKYLFTSGEILTEKDKQKMTDNLGNRIIDFYANTEAGIIAWQCGTSGNYHINADQIYVEIMDGERVCDDGEVGEVVITTLAPFSLPLIRYRTGDMAAVEHGRCKCGSWFPRLAQIKGRKNDFLVSSNGARISPYLLMSTMDKFEEVLRYSIHQNSLNDYTIYLKLNKLQENASLAKEQLRNRYSKIFGPKSSIMFADFSESPLPGASIKRKIINLDIK